MAEPLRIIFAGTPAFAATHLQALLEAGGPALNIVGVYTQPDRPAGRGKKASASAVKALALAHDLPVIQPATLKAPEAQAELAALSPDLMVVVAYGLILPQAVLATPRLGCINVHASILPRWRGAAPIQRAIEAGDQETGVTLMQMDAGLDTGPMLHITRCAIEPDETATTLHDKLAALGGPALLTTIAELAAGRAAPQPQGDTASCYAPKIDKREAALDWREPAALLGRRIRAFVPAPIAYGVLDGERIRIYRAQPVNAPAAAPGTLVAVDSDGLIVACGSGALRITQLQFPGGKVLSIREALNGRAATLTPGRRFTVDNHE